MADQRLVTYIKSELSRGSSLQQIKQGLISQGWSDYDINEAVNLATQKTFTSVPKSAMYEEPSKKSSKLWIIPVLIVAVIIIGGVFAFLFFRGTGECTENWQCSSWSSCTNNQQTRTCTDLNKCGTVESRPTVTQECTLLSQTTGPKEMYLEYKKEFDKTANLEEYIVVVTKYGSQSQIAKIDQAKSLPKEFKDSMFNIIKSVAPTSSQITNIIEEIKDDSATLLIETQTAKGTIKMVKESGIWKIEEDAWKEK